MTASARRALFIVAACGAGGAAMYHMLAAAGVLSLGGGTIGRHLAFVGIDGLLAWLLVRRPPWLIIPVALLTVQQFGSHGSQLVRWWTIEHRVDWVSLALLPGLVVLVGALWVENRERRAARMRDADPR